MLVGLVASLDEQCVEPRQHLLPVRVPGPCRSVAPGRHAAVARGRTRDHPEAGCKASTARCCSRRWASTDGSAAGWVMGVVMVFHQCASVGSTGPAVAPGVANRQGCDGRGAAPRRRKIEPSGQIRDREPANASPARGVADLDWSRNAEGIAGWCKTAPPGHPRSPTVACECSGRFAGLQWLQPLLVSEWRRARSASEARGTLMLPPTTRWVSAAVAAVQGGAGMT